MKKILTTAWICVALGLVFGGVGLCVWSHDPSKGIDKLGALGSYLQGSVGSFWALAGLLFIFATFRAQREQMQQQEAELANQNAQFKQQYDSARRQSFETSFFQLLRLHAQNIIGLRVIVSALGGYTPKGQGRGVFQDLYQAYKWEYSNFKVLPAMAAVLFTGKDTPQDPWEKAYGALYGHHQQELGHYFRTLYHCIKFVKTSDITDKRSYTSLVRAQLSAHELVMLFYNALSANGSKKFKPLIEEFGLFKNLDFNLLLNPSHKQLYADSAFQ